MTRAPMGGARLARWRRIDLRRLVVGDLPLKSAAIAVALLLWVAAVRNLPPPDVVFTFDGRVPVERPDVPEGYILRGTLGDVGVRLRGPEGTALGQEQLRATLDLSKVVPGPELQEAPVKVTVAAENVVVVEVTPAAVPVRLERRIQRTLPVQARFANEPPTGFQPGTATFRPQEVTVSGAESLVATVTAVLATMRFGDAPFDLAQDVRPIPVDASGQPIEGVEVDPVGVQVSVPVVPTATTRTVPILWQLRGAVATGYWIARVTTDPIVVTVSGQRTAIEGLERVDTGPVDVTGLSASRTFTVPLVVPRELTVLGAREATVQVTVVAIVGTRPFQVAVQAVNVGSGLQAEVTPETVEVIVAGPMPTLNALGPGSVTAIVDMSGRGPGTHTVDVAARVPSGTTAQSVQPARVTVTLTSR